MKRFLIMLGILFILIVLTIMTFIGKDSKKENESKNGVTKLKVAEVTHSVFYAPWYVALHNNYFDNLDIEVILTSGANNVTSAVLSGDVEIGFCGPEATIYVYKENKDDYVQSFAGLTKRDGQFLVLRKGIKYDNFKSIEGLTILGGRSGGMPLINFKQALKNENISNVKVDDTVDFANLSSAFIAGTGDGVNLFEPNATNLVKNGYGYIADSIGVHAGEVPYTAFNAKRSFIENNKDVIKTFYKGIEKGLEYVHTHSEEEIYEIIKSEFPDTKKDDLIAMIKNYKKYDSWLKEPKITEQSFKNLEDMIIDNNLLDKYVPYKDLVYEVN
ncbi:MAG: ABC transporter substrate-binding protein [Bacilli bacterium]|nr:ABC transporter substrate-binding protein [Bacilli bacterium]